MAVRSVLQIDVDDGAFRKFAEMFARYQQMLRDTPEAWRKVGDATDTVIDKTVSGLDDVETATEGVNKAASAMAVSFRQTFVSVNNYAGTIRRIGTEQSGLSRIVSGQARLWRDMGRYTHTFAQNIGEATRSLLRWGTLTGLISGLVGAGGLFGISRLATNAASGRREAAGLGNTIGQQRAFETNFGRLVDPQQFLGGVNEAMTNVAKSLPLVTAGIKYQGRSTADVSVELLQFIERLVDRTPEEFLGNTLQNYGLDSVISVERAKQLKHTSPEERAQIERQYRQDATQLNIPDAQAKAWTDLATQLSRAGQEIETSFTKALTKLAPQIERLSASVVTAIDSFLQSDTLKHWIDQLAAGVQWLATYLGGQGFQDSVRTFLANVDAFGAKVETFLGKFGDLTDYLTSDKVKAAFADFEDGVQQSAKFLGILWHTMDETGQAMASFAHKVLDPWLQGNPADPTRNRDDALQWNREHPDRPMPVPPAANDDIPQFDWRKPWTYDLLKRMGLGGRNDLLGHEGTLRNLELQQGLPSGLLNTVAMTESAGNRFAVSAAGAVGPFQFVHGTARQYGVQDPTDVDQSASGAARYLHDLAVEFKGDLAKVAAAYNWGQGNVEDVIRRYGGDWQSHLPAETSAYIGKIERGVGSRSIAQNGRPSVVSVNIQNNTGGNAVVSASQLAS